MQTHRVIHPKFGLVDTIRIVPKASKKRIRIWERETFDRCGVPIPETHVVEHVLMCEAQFAEKILSGTKPHTIRGERKRAIVAGDRLKLRMWSGKPYRSKQRKLRVVTVAKVTPIKIMLSCCSAIVELDGKDLSAREINKLALRDGFADSCAFFAFFDQNHGHNFTGNLIEWRA